MTYINNTAHNISDSSTWLIQFSLWPLRIVCPLSIILCPVANWICIRIFLSRIYERSSSKWYFIFIAIFDTIYVLVTAPLIFLLTLEIYILNWNVFFCKSLVFLNYLCGQISAGLLACLSIDRLIATSCLYIYRYNCTTNVSKYVCLFVICILSIVNSHYLIGYTIDSNGFCSARYYKWYGDIYSRLNVVYLLSYSIIPFTIITICNIFIVLSVCQNKSIMKKKYLSKKPNHHHNNNNHIFKFEHCSNENESKHQVFITINEDHVLNKTRDSNGKFSFIVANFLKDFFLAEWKTQLETRLSKKLLLDGEEVITPAELSPIQNVPLSPPPPYHARSLSSRLSSATYSQKMCIQLQITISLLAISISFIFCTLPNCISTIMIQTYNQNEQVRLNWQAINYLSIVPLLITHSVNLIFYYLSSNMFRNRFKEIYLTKTNSTKKLSLRMLFKS
jgi:hypothetical protein